MSLVRIILDTPLTEDGFKSVSDLAPGQLPALSNFVNYLTAILGGNQSGVFQFGVGATQSSATITSTGAAVAAETFTLLNVVFTAVASAPAANQFAVSATPSVQAANIAAAINASTNMEQKVSATSDAGVVTVLALVPGIIGKGLQLSEALTNVTVSTWGGGSDGAIYEILLR